jgi:hypothetical protein
MSSLPTEEGACADRVELATFGVDDTIAAAELEAEPLSATQKRT